MKNFLVNLFCMLSAGVVVGATIFGAGYLLVSFVEWEWVDPFWDLMRLLIAVFMVLAVVVNFDDLF